MIMVSRYLGVLRPLQRSLTLPALLLSCLCAQAVEPSSAVCARCHPKEVQAYARTGMAQSIFSVSQAPAIPSGAFTHAASNTQFTISATPFGIRQSSQRQNQITEQNVAFVIGSGNHAFGFLMQTGDHIFQSPLSYYTHRRAWDMAPGYEMNPHPDFARPIATECLLCHSGRPLPIAHTLNRFEPAVFASLAITCDRCHGSAEGHLKRPVPGSIVNPAKLAASERDSVCEQCHLKGEIRIPNPGKELTDFHPGQRAEDVFTTFVTSRPRWKDHQGCQPCGAVGAQRLRSSKRRQTLVRHLSQST